MSHTRVNVPSVPLPDGVVAVVKAECPTCVLVAPVLRQLREAGTELTIFTQDEPKFPEGLSPIHDEDLSVSYHHDIETVPTLIRVQGGQEVDRTVGWFRPDWEALTEVPGLGPDLPELRPGCGSLSVDPDMVDILAVRFGGSVLRSRRVEIAALEDEAEALFDRGWTDGLPVVAPTEARVLRMLTGTTRAPDEVVAIVPPDLVECTVEKVAINAVMAGAKPEYLPVILAALEAACTDEFNIHGVLATTMPVGPVADRQRPDPAGHRDELRRQRARAGQPRQPRDRPCAAARDPQRRWWTPGRRRSGRARQPGQALLLLRGGRRGIAVGVARGRARLRT